MKTGGDGTTEQAILAFVYRTKITHTKQWQTSPEANRADPTVLFSASLLHVILYKNTSAATLQTRTTETYPLRHRGGVEV